MAPKDTDYPGAATGVADLRVSAAVALLVIRLLGSWRTGDCSPLVAYPCCLGPLSASGCSSERLATAEGTSLGSVVAPVAAGRPAEPFSAGPDPPARTPAIPKEVVAFEGQCADFAYLQTSLSKRSSHSVQHSIPAT